MERKTFFAAIGSLMFLLGVVYLYTQSSEISNSTPTSISETDKLKDAERQKKISEAKKQVCDYLTGRISRLSLNPFNEEGRRLNELNGFKVTLECLTLDVNKFQEEHKAVCEIINRGLKENSSKILHPFLHRFYNDLNEKICKIDLGKIEDKQFAKTLEELKNNLSKLPILDSKTSAKDICERGLDLVISDEASLRAIIDYVYNNKSKLKNGSELGNLILKLETKAKEDNISVSEKVKSNFGLAKTADSGRKTSSFLNVCGYQKTKNIVEKNRIKSLQIVQELLDLVLKDESEEGKKMQALLLKLGTELTK